MWSPNSALSRPKMYSETAASESDQVWPDVGGKGFGEQQLLRQPGRCLLSDDADHDLRQDVGEAIAVGGLKHPPGGQVHAQGARGTLRGVLDADQPPVLVLRDETAPTATAQVLRISPSWTRANFVVPPPMSTLSTVRWGVAGDRGRAGAVRSEHAFEVMTRGGARQICRRQPRRSARWPVHWFRLIASPVRITAPLSTASRVMPAER